MARCRICLSAGGALAPRGRSRPHTASSTRRCCRVAPRAPLLAAFAGARVRPDAVLGAARRVRCRTACRRRPSTRGARACTARCCTWGRASSSSSYSLRRARAPGDAGGDVRRRAGAGVPAETARRLGRDRGHAPRDRVLISVVRDRLSHLIAGLSDAAHHDPLTELLNRRGFQEVRRRTRARPPHRPVAQPDRRRPRPLQARERHSRPCGRRRRLRREADAIESAKRGFDRRRAWAARSSRSWRPTPTSTGPTCSRSASGRRSRRGVRGSGRLVAHDQLRDLDLSAPRASRPTGSFAPRTRRSTPPSASAATAR